MMDTRKSARIFRKFIKGQASPKEKAIVESWYNEMAGKQDDRVHESDMDALKQDIWHQIDLRNTRTDYRRWWQAVAAAALFTAVLAVSFYLNRTPDYPDAANALADQIEPGGNKAFLTLGDGRTIELSTDQSGIVIDHGIAYQDGSLVAKPEVADQLLTLSTPKGGQYRVTLPDGTKVWLNASSSLRYPIAFTSAVRSVELEGEGYFEVAKGHQPFRVAIASQTVEVLGTHFNISGYEEDGDIKTTLLEGKVRVTATSSSPIPATVLVPGQQSILTGNNMQVVHVDTEAAVAWKNGFFIFDDEPLEQIMRKISRWYDIDIHYQPGVDRQRLFGGSISRYDRVSSVLDKLELTGGVHFEINERGITVMQ